MIKQSLVICGLLAALTFCSSHNTEDTAEGLAGTVGAEGAGGPQGEVGVPGVQGPMGAQGIAGQDGAVGERGEVGPAGQNATDELEIQLLGRAVLNSETPKGAAETVAYQASQDRVFAVNSAGDESVVAIVSTKDVGGIILRPNTEGVTTETNLSSSFQISVGTYTDGQAKGLAVSPSDRLLIVALAAKAKSQSGQIAIYDISADEPVFIKNIAVGFQPDMVTFTPDGKKILVVNEGEPMGDYSVDPEGSISVIEVVDGAVADEAVQVSFRAFNDQKDALESQGVVFANPTGRTIKGKLIQTTVAQDLEPEHIAVSSDSQTAYVSLQENNALAILDLTTSPVSVEIKGLGFKDWSGLSFDGSHEDGVNFQRFAGLYGVYQPDTLASYSWHGAGFVVSANEGESRSYFFDAVDALECIADGGLRFDEEDGCLAYTDEVVVAALTLGSTHFSGNVEEGLKDLKVSNALGVREDGSHDRLMTHGGRSMSIWDQNGLLVFDSGDQVARITASIHGEAFNNGEDTNTGDLGSAAKGAEPKALALGEVNGRTYAFLGLEGMGGIVVFDITNPYDVTFIDYFSNRGLVEGEAISGDLAPATMTFIGKEKSSTGEALLVIGNQISGSVAIWEIKPKYQ